jgi:hypothetical protein
MVEYLSDSDTLFWQGFKHFGNKFLEIIDERLIVEIRA